MFFLWASVCQRISEIGKPVKIVVGFGGSDSPVRKKENL